ncbi:uncharacterized protein B0P05DRAFT_563427 [Gilbertella persicaria]|uniref:uncharacterized protein n=1 Tax=Gilbertella persicaria TaxID=101096 RepID=UPI002220F87E|nr:uncharacterized protein B0P05DRAFT_563427 [Gilbertella persicaria]KAI8049796.1 hypothetical protein B0P05DRAFT_563427 [Gilbertella persicaria]
MDFTWVNDGQNPRKNPNPLQKSPNLSLSSARLPSDMTSQPGSRVSFTPALSPSSTSPLKRSRADTMPSQSSAFPYAADMYLVNPTMPPMEPSTRHRSGSMTLPTPFQPESGFSPYDPSSPIDENASNTIASTLASLGLDDEVNHSFDAERTSARGRSYTVAGQLNHLAPFSPFSPQTRSSVLHRPRAISLGMADSFSLFEGNQPTMPRPRKETPLRSSRSSSNLLDMHEEQEDDDQEYYGQPDGADSPSSAQAQIPSRALWLGNINPSISVPDLVQLFSAYGQVESARILSDKECAFVNFMTMESAVAAKEDLETRLGSKLGGTPVRVGFGKADVNLAMALTNEAGPNAQGPTRALWVGNIPANMNPAILRNIFAAFGAIESVRVLSHKNCGFINFDYQEDAVRARKALQNKEILGPGTGAVRIGFAKVPSNHPDETEDTPVPQKPVKPPTTAPEAYQATQWATAMMMTNMMMSASGQQQTTQPSLYTAIASERQFIMQQLNHEPSDRLKEDRMPLTYCSVIPPVPELSADRRLEPLRLREMRKRLENDENQSQEEVELIAAECTEEIVELCSDYIGNTVIQKLFEHCTEETKLRMLEKIAPFLASIGVHKNGTWAAQKIIDYANTFEQIQLVRQHIAPYVPLLLLDQFGNYVVQCCLRKGSEHNQYIFDAIVDKCWEIGQGRFGARAVRSILENPIATKEQQVYVTAAIVQNTVLLTTNANGVLLLNWLLDTSGLPGRYRVLCPRLLPYLNKLSSHKLGSLTVHKVINQTEEPDASALLLNALSDKAKMDLMNNKK